jgi:FKBP-type peptidyl-prolyl cis-trans isomerase
MKHFCKAIIIALVCCVSVFEAAAQTATEHGYRFVNYTKKAGAKAQPGETIVVHVDTWVGDSLMADTRALGNPREFKLFEKDKLPQRVPPLFDAAVLMTKGDSASVFQPIDSSIRSILPPALKDAKDVKYNVLMVNIITQADMDKKMAEAMARFTKAKTQTDSLAKLFKAGTLTNLQKTESGLQYMIHDMGKGKRIQANEAVSAHYYGCLTDGTPFDNSFERNEPLPFTTGIGQMIPGFDEGAQLLNHGGRATLFLPYKLAYGEEGTPGGPIPAKADLIFYIEME